MNEAKEILQREISGVTTNSKGDITRIWFRSNEQYYLDVKARTLKAMYTSKQYIGIGSGTMKAALRRAKEWKLASQSDTRGKK